MSSRPSHRRRLEEEEITSRRHRLLPVALIDRHVRSFRRRQPFLLVFSLRLQVGRNGWQSSARKETLWSWNFSRVTRRTSDAF